MILEQWAIKHNVSLQALEELKVIFGIIQLNENAYDEYADERNVQTDVRLEAAQKDVKLFRNNVGVLFNDKGQPVRYGLANDSSNMNKVFKSHDLIGWRKTLITQAMVGLHIAQFTSRECKRPDWVWRGSERELAQLAWANLVLADGGDASFCRSIGTL